MDSPASPHCLLTEIALAFLREQKALRKGRRGCLDALTIDKAVAEEVRVYRRNRIDYQKVFDLVPHR